MKNIDNLICIYNANGDDIKNIMLKIYSTFVSNELKEIFKT